MTDPLVVQLASKEGVTVQEVTETDLAITTSSLSTISWVFEITTTVSARVCVWRSPHPLQRVSPPPHHHHHYCEC